MMTRSVMMSRRLAAIGVAIVLVGVLGCPQPGAETLKVTGTVTYNGQPIEGVNVGFLPDSGRGAGGVTDASGRFTLSTFEPGDGAVPGTHKVVITEPSEDEPMPGTEEAENWTPPEPRFPAKYGDPSKSGFTATVERGKPNDFTFDMTDEE
jgi:hypothetical protein